MLFLGLILITGLLQPVAALIRVEPQVGGLAEQAALGIRHKGLVCASDDYAITSTPSNMCEL